MFGPSAIVTPANAVTVTRLLVSPVLLASIVASGDSWPAAILWVVLTASDGLDGWLARRQGTTRSGAFLDPLADKFLVIGALLALAARGRFSWVPVLLITVREVAMSAYRVVAGRRGISIPARRSAKVKTVLQELAVGFALLPLTAGSEWFATSLLWIAVVFTVVTGIQYLGDARRVRPAA